MLTKSDLWHQNEMPAINDISLQLYKDFYVNDLLPLRFYYVFTDESSLSVKFAPSKFRHLLGIQHIDRTTTDDNIFQMIDDGLCFDSWKADSRVRKKFNDMKDRIALFACCYHTLLHARIFYYPDANVPTSPNVKMEYLLHQQISNMGMNLGLKTVKGDLVPSTILPTRINKLKRYIDTSKEKFVKELVVRDGERIVEHVIYSDNFIMKATD